MVKAPRTIPAAVRATQARASDPAASAFVSANAGSGKTHVLVQRVIRLLLDGVPPEKILCITFTKAAAANMAERVFSTLGHWVTLDDDALDAAIREAGIAHPDAKLAEARAQTVRLRAGDAGRAEGADHPRAVHAAAAAISVRGQRAGALRRARRPRPERDDGARQSRGAAGGLARSRQRDRPRAHDRDGERGRRHLQGRGARGLSEPRSLHGLDRCAPAAPTPRRRRCPRRSASIASDRIEDVEREIVDGPNLPRSRWQEIAAILDTGSKSDQEQAARLREALALTGSAQVDEYLGVFLTERAHTAQDRW